MTRFAWHTHAETWRPDQVAEWKRAYSAGEAIVRPYAEHDAGECDHCDLLRGWAREVDAEDSPDDGLLREHAWLAAHVYIVHRGWTGYPHPCGCGFCVWYRGLHGDDVDPWVGPWPTLRIEMREPVGGRL